MMIANNHMSSLLDGYDQRMKVLSDQAKELTKELDIHKQKYEELRTIANYVILDLPPTINESQKILMHTVSPYGDKSQVSAYLEKRKKENSQMNFIIKN
jgi:hypothetical protein